VRKLINERRGRTDRFRSSQISILPNSQPTLSAFSFELGGVVGAAGGGGGEVLPVTELLLLVVALLLTSSLIVLLLI